MTTSMTPEPVIPGVEETSGAPRRLAVLTSGGDAQGMNAVVRAVVRTGIHLGAQVYAVNEGWQGAVDGGRGIRRLAWDDVGSILHRGGTMIGTARSKDFREREGQLKAARHLLEHGIDRVIVVGGDGSLTGANEFRMNWPDLLGELVSRGELEQTVAQAHPAMMIVGLVGSIDNDMVGTDMTIGADSALHRVVDAIDAIASTAASHQRTFVIEVMGRHCGYLPLMAGLAGGCDYVLIPEQPPADGWQDRLCELMQMGRAAGRRDSIVLVAEGTKDRHGNHISPAQVKGILEERLGEDARVTILGHVQRGGSPSAYDRWMSTLLGYAAVQEVLQATPGSESNVLGVRHNRIAQISLMESVAATRGVAGLIQSGDYQGAMAARGGSFAEMVGIFRTMALPPALAPASGGVSLGSAVPQAENARKKVAIMHAGGLAPGMNSAARAAVRMGIEAGWSMWGVQDGFAGLIEGDLRELSWADVDSWVGEGGAELGTRRAIPTTDQLYSIGRTIERHELDALLVVGGYSAYEGIFRMFAERRRYPAFRLPMVLVPATIDNNLPGSELSIGADTALNNAVWALDRIKQSASATTRCFVVETMGRRCGYLALMAGLASGAERVYLHEEGVTLAGLAADVEVMKAGFRSGRKLFLAVRNEQASAQYTTDFLARLFEQEGSGLFDVRQNTIGHQQQGGSPSPFDRILATRLARFAVDVIQEQFAADGPGEARYLGLVQGVLVASPVAHMLEHLDLENRRPLEQWWMQLRPAIRAVTEPHAAMNEVAIPVLRAE